MKPAELVSRDDDPVCLAPGQTLFREGETGDCMYVLLEGSADVFVGEVLVESVTPGALLGEMALVDSSLRAHGGCDHASAPGQDRRAPLPFSRSTDALFRHARDESAGGTAASYELDDEKSGGGLGVCLGRPGLEPGTNALKGRCSTD